jgi:sugar O-acyltransferase (sialic acid O-acetyltransferase NeuD family)
VIGYQGVNQLRARKYEQAKKKGYKLLTYIDERSAIAEGVEIGDNCIISANQSIDPFVKIGNDVIIRNGSYIGHHVVIGDHCFIANHVAISGGSIIEPYTFLGINSTIRNGVKIGKGCVIGAGALILKDTGEYEVYRGIESEFLPKKSFEINI